MFSVYCETTGRPTLLGPHAITSIENTEDGMVMYFRCHCGASGFVTGGRGMEATSYHGPAVADEPTAAAAAR